VPKVGPATVHNVQDEDPHVIMAAWQDCREWLRFHGDYDVQITLWGPAGCHVAHLLRLNRIVYQSMGGRLGKRLADIVQEMRSIDCRTFV
jgi:hypothetical protein